MADIPHAPLSDALEERIGGRRLVSAVFLTYKFEPAFFEQEVLPVLFDVPLSHASAIRLVQLEDCLREIGGEIAVLYDAKGLVTTGNGSAKLDVRRIPVLHRTGIFHPKNIFLLLESREPLEDGTRERALLVACLSANLTRAGWWENVEVCHFEELRHGDKTLLRDDLVDFLEGLKRRALAGDRGQHALDDILAFLRRSTEQRTYRSSGVALHTRFYAGREPLLEFLSAAASDRIHGANLEVISPYLDEADSCAPLEALVEAFRPKEVRVLLPRGQSGEALCREALFKRVRDTEGVSWASLPVAHTRAGRGDDVVPRFVHAKVYRFFSRNPAREILFIGSANLTTAAHQRGGNLETGFLVEVQPRGRPEFWLEADSRKPTNFDPRPETDEIGEVVPPPLSLRYNWGTHSAEALWLEGSPSPLIRIEARGSAIGEIRSLPARAWTGLSETFADRLREVLDETSFVRVVVAREETAALILVQEEGMGHKPSLVLSLSVADILRYWAMLTPAQRAAFIEAKWPSTGPIGGGEDLVARLKVTYPKDTLFDKFSGFFHAFNAMEASVRNALGEKRARDAAYRLFGKKYDSLPTLLDRLDHGDGLDAVERYVIVQCATQLIAELRTAFPEFSVEHARDVTVLSGRVAELAARLREALLSEGADGMGEFLEWFDRRFVERAKPVELVPSD